MILITGGTGFLGSALIQQLLNNGDAVRATKRLSSQIPEVLLNAPRIHWVNADVNDYFALEAAFDGITRVYHCAALISNNPADKKNLLKVNVEGTANVVNLSLEHGVRLVHVSSIAALGTAKKGLETTEEDWWEFDGTQSGYSIAKYEAEMEVWRGIAEGLDAVIVNPSLIIGAAAGDKGSGAVFSLLHKGLKFYTQGSVGLIDVEDVAKAMILLMNNTAITGQRFILSNENMTHKELLSTCSNYLNKPAPRIKATSFMLGIAWRAARLASIFTGKAPLLTKESTRSSQKKMRFSNKKIINATGITFKPIDKTLHEICSALLNNTQQ